MSAARSYLLARKKDLLEQLRVLKPLQDELADVEHVLDALDKPKRGGGETVGHENGCRCHECDHSRCCTIGE